jgi:flagellin
VIVNTNIPALTSALALKQANNDATTASERIASGLRINSAKDDPAGIGQANRLKAQIASYAKATENINSGIAIVQKIDSSLSQISDILISMRDLASSSSSGATSSDTRSSNQTQLGSYRDDINTISNTTTWNGQSVMNGSLSSLSIQSGIDSRSKTALNFYSALTSALGIGSPLAVSSLGSNTNAMASGDLFINGISVGATSSSDDNLSYADKDGSAIAKAAAINLVSSSTNVQAVVGTTTASGSSMSAVGSDTTGTVTINGTSISLTLYVADSVDTSRASVISTINNYSGQTGVVAVDGETNARGVLLTAEDGRNITVVHSTLTASQTGLAADDTYAGTYTLRDLDGASSITLSSAIDKDIRNADFAPGTYSANAAQVTTQVRSGSTAAPSVLASGDLSINGVAINVPLATDDTATAVTTTSATKDSSAIALAAAINRKTTETGVTATANANTLVGTGFAAGSVDSIFLNGVTIAASLTNSSTRQDVADLLNTVQGQTGVIASDNGDGLTLTASDGRTISIGLSNSGSAVSGNRIGLDGNVALTGAAATSAGAMAFISTVSLSSESVFTVESGSNGAVNFETIGFREGSFGGLSSEDIKLSALDISTQTGGSNALTVIDGAIEMVSNYQGLAGAQESRLDLLNALITDQSNNASSAYGSIMDADLAAEATNLALAQIRQNAATAMLAQANTTPAIVSYLLRQYTG